MFANSSLVIIGGSYTQVSGTGQGFDLLHRHIASGALHDSGERFNPPRCHPETRGALLSEIMEWITNVNRETLIMWLYGSVGSGKSALSQSVAERCQELGLLAASFFFARLSAERCHEKQLSPTISYQLAISVPETRSYIEHIVQRDPSIFGRAFQTQYQHLVVNPLCLAARDIGLQPRPQLVIIDGLDECQDPKAQRYILDVINQEFQRRTNLPLIFLITSRPEEHIRMSFSTGTLERISKQVSLQDYFGSHDDVRNFIRNRFENIKREHPLRLHISSTWPAQDIIESLVRKSSSQFAYASTVMEYVSSAHHRPTDRLDAILGLSGPVDDSPFAEVDSLYKHLFSSLPHKNGALRILSVVILMDLEVSPELVEQLLTLKTGDVRLHLGGLASVASFIEHHLPIKILNTSLAEFLLDTARSGDLALDLNKAHADLAIASLHHLEKLEVPILADYACYNLERHLDLAAGTNELHDAIQAFRLDEFVKHSARVPYQLVNSLSTTLEDIWYFVPSFFDCVRNSIIFKDADAIYNHHATIFDQYLETELDKYMGDSRLADLVTMLTVCHSPATVPSLESVSYFKDDILQLNGASDHLVLIDENSLNIRHMVRRHGQSEPYIELLCQFLEDEGRAGRHFIDGDRYAQAALRCSKRISRSNRSSMHDEHGAGSFLWSLECTPPLLLHASHNIELTSYLESAVLDTVESKSRRSFYPALSQMVKEARIAYLISSSYEECVSESCHEHARLLSLVPQGLRISRPAALIVGRMTSAKSAIDFNEYLIGRTSRFSDDEVCCCFKLLVEYYFCEQIWDRRVHHEAHTSRGHSSVIVHVEDPFPEIISTLGQESTSVDATSSGVIKILTYRVWRGLIQRDLL